MDDLRIAHDRFGSSPDPNLNGHLHYLNDIDKSLNEAAADKICKYRSDYNNNPPSTVSFMTPMSSTSGRLHSEFIRLLFLQAHRETDRFLQLQDRFLQLQEFSLHSVTVDCSVSVTRCSQKSATPSSRMQLYVSA